MSDRLNESAAAAAESLELIRSVAPVLHGKTLDIVEAALLVLLIDATYSEFDIDGASLPNGERCAAMDACLVLLRNRAAKILAARN